MKIQRAADANKIPVKTYCDNVSVRYQKLFKSANISHTDFVRTTESRHQKAVQTFWVTIIEVSVNYTLKIRLFSGKIEI